MEKLLFDKLCKETFKDISDDVRIKIPSFPEDINLGKDKILSNAKLLELMKKPVFLQINDDYELYYIDDAKNEIIIDPRIEDTKVFNKYIEDVLDKFPDVPFDQYCGGIKRKQQEVAAAYTVCVVNAFLNRMYQSDIDEVKDNYDWNNNKSKIVEGKTFSDVFKRIQEDATPIVKFIITCCYTVLSNTKEKNDALYIGIVSQEDQEVLEQIIKEVRSLEFQCNKKVNTQENKLERLQTIKEKDDKIANILKGYGKKFEVLYKLNKLNSTNLNANFAPIIKQSSRKEAKILLKEGKITDNDYYKKYVKRQSNKAIRLLVSKMKMEKFEKFSSISKANGVNFEDLIPKN